MKKLFLSLCMAMMAMTMSAQEIVVGDMNDDGKVTVEDITKVTETALGRLPLRTMVAMGYGTAVITCAAQDGSGVVGTCTVRVKAPDTKEYVDLGLSVKWATCNVGASTPEEYGDYFAWGETEPQSNSTYSWASYKWCNDGSSSKMTKYSTSTSYWDATLGTSPDGKTVLDPEDDAATVNWGGDWCMPTDAQWTELRNTSNCTWTWDSTKKGYTVTSKVSGYEGNSIFLPAAGFRGNGSLSNAGSSGYYWSSSLNTDYPIYACFVYFNSSYFIRSNNGRYYGFSVRPVRSAK